MNERRDSFYLRIIFGLSLIGFLLYKIPLTQTIQILKDTSIALLVISIFITGAGIVLSSFKLQILARLRNKKIALWPVIKAYYIGFFFNNFMPTDIGGDIFKINELKKNDLELRDATAAVIIERLMGSLALIILALFLALPGIEMFERVGMGWLQTPLLISMLILTTGLIATYATWKSFLKPYLKERRTHIVLSRIYRIIQAFYVYKNNLKVLFQALTISLVFHFLGSIILLILTAAVGYTLPFMSLLLVIPIVTFVSLLPVSIGALGLKEGAIVYCLSKLGLAAPTALGVALLLRLSIYVHSGIGGLLYSLKR